MVSIGFFLRSGVVICFRLCAKALVDSQEEMEVSKISSLCESLEKSGGRYLRRSQSTWHPDG